jgi:hypothetical protein
MYDYVLGGKDNYAADRAAAEAGLKVWPDMVFIARETGASQPAAGPRWSVSTTGERRPGRR